MGRMKAVAQLMKDFSQKELAAQVVSLENELLDKQTEVSRLKCNNEAMVAQVSALKDKLAKQEPRFNAEEVTAMSERLRVLRNNIGVLYNLAIDPLTK